MYRRTTFFLAIFIAAHLSAQQMPEPLKQSSPDITQDEIALHLRWLASDELEGRGTGTAQNNLAAAYLAREFQRYGLKPAGDNGTYLQTFEVVTAVEAGRNNSLNITYGGAEGRAEVLELHRGFVPLSFSKNGSATAPVVFAGFGINAQKLKYNDYDGIDVRGKIVLVATGNPDEDNPHSEFDNISSLRSKAMFARDAGAAAILYFKPDGRELTPLRYDNSPSDAGIIAVDITPELAAEMLKAASQTIPDILKSISAEKKPRSFALPGVSAAIAADVHLVRKPTSNVIGVIDGTDPAFQNQMFVVGAHYDHLGWGQDGSLYRGKEPQIHNGADDNASGTAGILELAQYFAAHPARHPMLFMGFAAEEMGTLGSLHWVNAPTRPLASIAAMFNLDMVGRLVDSTRKLTVQGTGTSPVWDGILKAVNDRYRFDLGLMPDGLGASDQSSFYVKNIPVLFFFTGLHTDYHRPSDDFDKINLPGEVQVVRFAADVIRKTDSLPERPAFVKVQRKEEQRTRGFSVYVGTIPDYGATEEGFKITGTSPGSPAEKAGLLAGDIITEFGTAKVKNIYDYMNALGLYKPDEDVPVKIRRGQETLTLTVHLVKR